MTRSQYWIVTILGLFGLCVFALNVTLLASNRGIQREIAARQQFVQQSVQLETLYREIVRALAELAARNNDADVRSMLGRHGITYTVDPPARAGGASGGSGTAAPTAPAGPPRK